MIADTTFLIHLVRERARGVSGPAQAFLAAHRTQGVRTSIISLSEVAPSFLTTDAAWEYFKRWPVYRLHDGIAKAAADLDREMGRTGRRLGENDNWIAAFCRYYREPIISLDAAFERVPRLRRLPY
jgi:predicted nucleic acid-binding protein